jgi:hypothetical protein
MFRRIKITLPELLLLAATRGMLGAGLGMLATAGLSARTRKSIGLPLFLIGAVSTIPFAVHIFKRRQTSLEELKSRV